MIVKTVHVKSAVDNVSWAMLNQFSSVQKFDFLISCHPMASHVFTQIIQTKNVFSPRTGFTTMLQSRYHMKVFSGSIICFANMRIWPKFERG